MTPRRRASLCRQLLTAERRLGEELARVDEHNRRAVQWAAKAERLRADLMPEARHGG